MAGRPRIFDRSEALDAFVDVFWTYGYAGADIDKLQTAAGIQRGSFYAAFEDKASAFREALDRYLEQILFPKLAMLETPDKGALAEFLMTAGDFISRQGVRGCLLSEAFISVDALDPDTQEEVRNIRTRLFRRLKQLSGGDGAKAAFVLSSALGLHAFARSGASRKQIREAAGFAAAAVSGGWR